MKNKQILVLILAVFLLSFVSASYNFSNYSIQTQYATGSAISGNLKISFTNEPINSLFTDDSFGNSVSLKDLISASPNYNHDCAYPECESKFKEADAQNNFSFQLNEGESVFYGFILRENLVKINSISFDLSSTATESPTNQLSVDLLNDGVVNIENDKKGSSLGNESFGCYVPSNETELDLTSTYACQKISLEDSPDVQIGAWVDKVISSEDSSVQMRLFDTSQNSPIIGSCFLSITSKGVSFCDANTSVKKGDYYVCVKKGGIGSGEYKIRGHYQSENCGFVGVPPQNPIYAYQIGAKQNYYGNFESSSINNILQSGENLSNMVESYIIQNYGNLDCSVNNCIVPIKFTSSKNQTITINNLNMDYNIQVGHTSKQVPFSQFIEDPSLVNSSMGTLSLGQFFKLPNEAQNITYKLNYKGNQLFSKKISLKSFNINLYPTTIPVSFPNSFYLLVPSELVPVHYSWDFGDNSSQITSTPRVSHSYQLEGNYTISVLITTNIGDISKSFSVQVGSAKDVLNSKLKNKDDALTQIESLINSLSIFEKNQVSKIINIQTLRANLTTLQNEENLATSEADYNSIAQEFLNLNFPTSLQKVEVSRSFLNPSQSLVDLNALSSVTGINYSDSPETYDYIAFWNVDNLNSALSQNSIIINWGDGTASSINIYSLSLISSKTINGSYYLFAKDTGNLNFSDNSKVRFIPGYKYVPLSGSGQDFIFSADENFQAGTDLFVSPSEVIIFDTTPIPESQTKTWIIYLGILGVLIIGFIIYLIMVYWYKVKYEKFLFPDKNQLYNAIVYITTLTKNGTSEDEIKNNLLKAGWKREQVTYLLHKYAGKRTGMPKLFGSKEKKIVDTRSPPKPGRNTEFKSIDDTKFNK